MVEGVGFEPTKLKVTDLQSARFDRLHTPLYQKKPDELNRIESSGVLRKRNP